MPSPLRAKLRRLLALSLSTPLVTAVCAAACGTTNRPASSPIDAGTDSASPDASPDDASACAPIRIEAGFFGEDGSCASFVLLPCGLPPGLPVYGCNLDVDLCVSACPQKFFITCQFPAPTCEDGGVVPDASIYLDCSTCLGNIGRRPVGLVPPAAARAGRGGEGESEVGRYFALAAYLEGASVEAFLQLRERLALFGAPPGLRRRASRAAGDERRHARTTSRLARRHGARGQVEAPVTGEGAPVALTFEDFVLENAVEGCVRETFGALLSMHQSERAADPAVARAMGRIAVDETRHAELAWAIHRWALPRLSWEARLRVRRAQAKALLELRARAGAWSLEVARVAGLPDRALETRLATDFASTLFGAGAPTQRGITH